MSIQQVFTEEVTRGLRPTGSGGVSHEDHLAVCGDWMQRGDEPREEAPAIQVEDDGGLGQGGAW